MAKLTIRQKLIILSADAAAEKTEFIYNSLKEDRQDDYLQMLEGDREAHGNGQSKSYSRQEATEIIKGKRGFWNIS